MPSGTNGSWKRAFGAAYTRSQCSSRVLPMPTAGPPTAATTGFFMRGSTSNSARAGEAPGLRVEEVGHVVAGGEAVRAAVEQHRAHLRVGFRGGERGAELSVHFDGNRVLLVEAVEAHARHPPFLFTFDQAGNP